VDLGAPSLSVNAIGEQSFEESECKAGGGQERSRRTIRKGRRVPPLLPRRRIRILSNLEMKFVRLGRGDLSETAFNVQKGPGEQEFIRSISERTGGKERRGGKSPTRRFVRREKSLESLLSSAATHTTYELNIANKRVRKEGIPWDRSNIGTYKRG
jgi:hypothetical protein